MEMINRCLEVNDDKRDEIEAHDRHQKRKELLAMRMEMRETRPADWGNRKERRRQAALLRQGKETA